MVYLECNMKEKEFNLSEEVAICKDTIVSGSIYSEKAVKEFIKKNLDIDNELADEIFKLQARGERIDIHLLFKNAQDKKDKLAGDNLI